MKIDFKEELHPCYYALDIPQVMCLPERKIIYFTGVGKPADSNYQAAIQRMYGTIYGIKMSGKSLPNYHDFVVPPMETSWSESESSGEAGGWNWELSMTVPNYVDENVLSMFDSSGDVRIKVVPEQRCVQRMFIGPYTDNTGRDSVSDYIELYIDEGYFDSNKKVFHEVYLSDPRRTKPEKLRWIVRIVLK